MTMLTESNGWANEATYNITKRLNPMNFRNYRAWLNSNPCGTIKDFCASIGIVDEEVDWFEIEDVYGKK
jgi:hypothetical protein